MSVSEFNFVFVEHTAAGEVPTKSMLGATSSRKYLPGSAFALALDPSSVSYQASSPSFVRITQGGTSVQRSKFRRYDISLVIDLGLRSKLGFDRDGFPRYADGNTLAQEFEAWLREVVAVKSGRRTRITMHDALNKLNLWVEPTNWNMSVDQSSRLYPGFTVQLIGYDMAGAAGGALGSALTWSDKLNDLIRYPKRFIERGIGYLALLGNQLDQVADVADEVLSYFDHVADIATVMTEIADRELWMDEVKGIESTIDALIIDLAYATDRLVGTSYMDDLRDVVDAADDLHSELLRGGFMASTEYAEGEGTGAIYEWRSGDTLESIAEQVLGDAEKWVEIADLNGLAAPYASEGGLPGTVSPGDKLLLPVGADVLEDDTASRQSQDDASLYGIDWALTEDGDLKLEQGLFATDIELVSGIPCLLQNLKVQLDTIVGQNPLFPEMGLEAAIGDVPSKGAGSFLATTVAQLNRDGRIARVRDESVSTTGLSYDVTATAVLRTGRRVNVAATAKAV